MLVEQSVVSIYSPQCPLQQSEEVPVILLKTRHGCTCVHNTGYLLVPIYSYTALQESRKHIHVCNTNCLDRGLVHLFNLVKKPCADHRAIMPFSQSSWVLLKPQERVDP